MNPFLNISFDSAKKQVYDEVLKSVESRDWDESAPVQSIITCQEECEIDESTVALAEDWNNDYLLWSDTLNKNPESASATSSLGVQYFLFGEEEKSYQYHKIY